MYKQPPLTQPKFEYYAICGATKVRLWIPPNSDKYHVVINQEKRKVIPITSPLGLNESIGHMDRNDAIAYIDDMAALIEKCRKENET